MKIKNLFRRGKEQRKEPCMRMKPSIENEDKNPFMRGKGQGKEPYMRMKPSIVLIVMIRVNTPNVDSLLDLRSKLYSDSTIGMDSSNCVRTFISRL